jgi:hypothetical protein
MIPVQSPHPPGVVGVAMADLARYAAFFVSLDATLVPDGTRVVWQQGYDVSLNRNRILEGVLDDPSVAWVWLLDDDHVWHPECLLGLLNRKVDIAQCLSSTRMPPFHPISTNGEGPQSWEPPYPWRTWEQCWSGLQSTWIVGGGGLLLSREAVRRIPKPLFSPGQIRTDSAMEDVNFSRKALEAGLALWTDCDHPMGHISTGVVWPEANGVRVVFGNQQMVVQQTGA